MSPPEREPAFWALDPSIDFLNHGSFGACPAPVLRAQSELRAELEREPVAFMVERLEPMLDAARAELAAFLRCRPDDLAPVANATEGVNTVLRSLALEPGDRLLTTNHEYNACNNALRFAAQRAGAHVDVAEIPFPIAGAPEAVDAVLRRVTDRTRLALLSHVTSPTALVLPIERLVRELQSRGVDVLVDGAHAPGMIELHLDALDAAYYTGNCHKWLCAPKGAGFLHARRDRQEHIRPLVISHGANSPRTDRSRFQTEFAWTGTRDHTPFLCIPHALRALEDRAGGWDALRTRNRDLALRARELLAHALAVEPPAPADMIGSIAAMPLPEADTPPTASPLYADPLQDTLLRAHRVQVPIIPWPAHPQRLVRVSAQLYNHEDQYRRLADALTAELAPRLSSGRG